MMILGSFMLVLAAIAGTLGYATDPADWSVTVQGIALLALGASVVAFMNALSRNIESTP